MELIKGKLYRFKNSSTTNPEPLRYIGQNWSGNGFWHQFTKDGKVWCELQDSDLRLIELVE